jgi:hypothetical protein
MASRTAVTCADEYLRLGWSWDSLCGLGCGGCLYGQGSEAFGGDVHGTSLYELYTR